MSNVVNLHQKCAIERLQPCKEAITTAWCTLLKDQPMKLIMLLSVAHGLAEELGDTDIAEEIDWLAQIGACIWTPERMKAHMEQITAQVEPVKVRADVVAFPAHTTVQ